MSEDNDRDRENYEQKKKTRRTRKDEQGRNFTCPCGKSYLSYPALYTHIKTKHHGKAPKQQTTLTLTQAQALKIQNSDEQENANPLTQIKQLVEKAFPYEDAAVYPSPLSEDAGNYVREVTELYEEVRDGKMDDEGGHKLESINFIFGRFLTEMKRKVKPQAYTYLSDLLFSFHLNITQQKKDPSYCKNNNGSQLPHFFNDLIVQKRVPALHVKPDQGTNALTFACKILFSFGVWLFQQKFTSYAVKFNTV